MKPILFLLNMPFKDDSGQDWFCTHCALLEGALKVNPQWKDNVDIRRINFPKPRKEVIHILGEDQQWLPVLVLPNKKNNQRSGRDNNISGPKFGWCSPSSIRLLLVSKIQKDVPI